MSATHDPEGSIISLAELIEASLDGQPVFPDGSITTYPTDPDAPIIPVNEWDWNEIDALPVDPHLGNEAS